MDNLVQDVVDGITAFVYSWTGREPNFFTEVMHYTETYDGNGSTRLYLKNDNIQTLNSVVVNGVPFPLSSGFGVNGIYVGLSQNYIALRWGSGIGNAAYGNSNQWGAPYMFYRGQGNVVVDYNAGYAATPADLYMAVLKMCTQVINKRLREDEASKNIPEVGTVSYRAWKWGPDVMQILNNYRRTALVSA